mmetsp:Transcript_59100/g.105076  ORF Transcript_59100/g.105076 Transcript_59100/m.105076 type:complete len:250 (-) Transcript_59100:269-1018(-)|eukprot:CAMPEP_0197664854 /NCGR_PEP_ID=MMETSP1338-20131121/58891_1 /TAXON_ID=43686 ORGANISM="Pelagodinium beii, Strain RCC1491" /NCGR_SAMPLE_ID=MMETSP1338 /ASSEMBLY_ACC=CAM_ASM_000754 /LENGTH=249 /DNA_ID=CAMNT_0043243577 /DNA_START=66 /DNA_END=815 /DNA_ORIENTATION=+
MSSDPVFLAGFFAGVMGILAHGADVLTCFSARRELSLILLVPEDILDFEKATLMMAEKTFLELALGHILALTCIPAGFAGAYLIFNVIRPKYHYLRWPVVILLFSMYVAGALMHCSFTFVGLMATQPGFAGSDLAKAVKPFFETICSLVGRHGMLPGSLFIFCLFGSGATELPRWTCLVTPGLLQLVAARLALHAPFAVRIYVLVTIYNMSSGLWHLTMAFAYRAGKKSATYSLSNKAKIQAMRTASSC